MKGDDEGSAILETVLLAPVLILILAALIGAGRLVLVKQRVDAVANQAGRAATAAQSPAAAKAAAVQAANDAMEAHGLECSPLSVTVDVSNFQAAGSVRTSVTCVADLGDGFPGLSGKRTLSATSVQVIERFRDVTP